MGIPQEAKHVRELENDGPCIKYRMLKTNSDFPYPIWVCLKIGYIPNEIAI